MLNLQGRWAGDTDSPLSPEGAAECAALAQKLVAYHFVGVYSTDLERSKTTAELLATGNQLTVLGECADLRERQVGAWTGLDRSEITTSFAQEYDAWITGQTREIPGAEPWDHLISRSTRGVLSIARALNAGSSALVVTHAQVLTALCDFVGISVIKHHNLSGHWFEVDDDTISYLGAYDPHVSTGDTLA